MSSSGRHREGLTEVEGVVPRPVRDGLSPLRRASRVTAGCEARGRSPRGPRSIRGRELRLWHRGQDLDAFLAEVRTGPLGFDGIPLYSGHQMGSARMGTDSATSVAQPSGELHDVAGVWIAVTPALSRPPPGSTRWSRAWHWPAAPPASSTRRSTTQADRSRLPRPSHRHPPPPRPRPSRPRPFPHRPGSSDHRPRGEPGAADGGWFPITSKRRVSESVRVVCPADGAGHGRALQPVEHRP